MYRVAGFSPALPHIICSNACEGQTQTSHFVKRIFDYTLEEIWKIICIEYMRTTIINLRVNLGPHPSLYNTNNE